MKIFKFICVLSYLNCINIENSDTEKEKFIIEKNDNFDQKKFSLFLKNLNKNEIKCFFNRYFCYMDENIMYIFDSKENIIKKVSFNFGKKTNIDAFLFDGNFIYLIMNKSILQFNLDGNQIKQNENCFKTNMYKLDIYNDIILAFGHNHEIFAFVDFEDKLNLIWFFNDINNSVPYDFCYKFHDNKIFMSHNYRVCILDVLNGDIINNYYLDYSYNNLSIRNNNIFVYDILKNCTINLANNEITYSNEFSIGEKKYTINNQNKIISNDKEFKRSYLNNLFFDDSFIAFNANNLNSEILIINNKGENELYLRYFVLKNIFYINGKYILLDEKFGRFKVI